MAVADTKLSPVSAAPTDEPVSSQATLPEDYYVTAFLVVLDTVSGNSEDLLSATERTWAKQIRALPVTARRLYVRLLQRRGSTFRLGKLRYDDVPDIAGAAQVLDDAGLATTQPPEELDELLEAYTLTELDTLIPDTGNRSARRPEKVAAVLARASAEDQARLASADQWLRITGHELFNVYRLCFFGNLYQDMSEFVTTALGTHRYEPVPLQRASRHFRSRAQIEAHLRYHECSLLFAMQTRRSAKFLKQLVSQLPSVVESDQHLQRRLDRLKIEMARGFERLGEHQSALHLYASCRRAPARERQVRLLRKLEREHEAQVLLHAMQADPDGESEQDFAERQLAPRGRQTKAFRPRTTSLVLPATQRRVEQAAADYFARDGNCHWIENRLFTSLLGLWIWDIVFSPVRGAFFNPFQSAPADLRERSFRSLRAEALTERFSELTTDGAFERRVRAMAQSRAGISNRLVSWELVQAPVFEKALARIPVADLAVIFDRMLDDLSNNTTGLPDLVHFPERGGYELIEIKGPGDALQSNQRRWFRHFDAHGIAARVVKIRWTSAGG